MSVHFKAALILMSALLGGAVTAFQVVGPISRIEQWFRDWEVFGKKAGDLRVRRNDPFSILSQLLNSLRDEVESHQK